MCNNLKIYTITLNPALDYHISLSNLKLGHINKPDSANIFMGGKGINVSTLLSKLNVSSTAIGFIGKYYSDILNNHLYQNGINNQFTLIEENTRINVNIKTNHNETTIAGSSPNISNKEFDGLLSSLKQIKTSII